MDTTNVVIISMFSTYDPRAYMVKKYLENNGKSVKLVTTDFEHRSKCYRTIEEKNIYVHTLSYKRNLSLKRIYSHLVFAKTSIKVAMSWHPEMIYLLIPGNSLMFYYNKYYGFKSTKLIVDIIDLWPESLPLNYMKKNPVLNVWKKMRDRYLKNADLVITECDLYQSILNFKRLNISAHTVYWPTESINSEVFIKRASSDTISFLYLGSINNIIDIPLIIELLKCVQIYKKVKVHIVGTGEKEKEFLKQLKDNCIEYDSHGCVYNPQELKVIADQCSYGLNIMKKQIAVGLTMKSVTYFDMGLPVINNIVGDISKLIEKYNCGLNISNSKDVYKLLEVDDVNLHEMSQNARQLYLECFSPKAFEEQLRVAFEKFEYQ